MFRKATIGFLVILPLFFSCCTGVRELVETFLQKPQITLEDVSVTNISLLEATMVFHYKITNPNPIGAKLDNIAYTLTFNDKEFVKGNLDQGIQIKAAGSEIVELPITINYLELFQSVAGFIQAETIDYQIFGSAGVGLITIPYSKRGVFNVPRIPKVSMNKVRLSSITLLGASLVFSLDLSNSNPFTLSLSGLEYRIKLGGTEFAQGTTANIASLSENGKTTIEIPLNVSFLKLGKSAYTLLTQGSCNYEISGNLKVNSSKIGEQSFPFQKIGEVPIGR